MESAFAVYRKNQPQKPKAGFNKGGNKKAKKVNFNLTKNKKDGIKKAKNQKVNNKNIENTVKNVFKQQSNGFQQNGKNQVKKKNGSAKPNQNEQNNKNTEKNVSPDNKQNQKRRINPTTVTQETNNQAKQPRKGVNNNTGVLKSNKQAESSFLKTNKQLDNNLRKSNKQSDNNLHKPNINLLKSNKQEVTNKNELIQAENGNSKRKQGKSAIKRKLEEEEIPQLIEFPMEDSYSSDGLFDDEFSTKGAALLKWLLFPVTPEQFFSDYWEVGPLHVKRDNEDYYKDILTTSDIDVMLREHPLYFGRNVDLVTYKDGKRLTENPVGRAKASIVLNAYSVGYSVRILNPHTYNHKVHLILATLQEYFGTMVGVNVYLTPAGSQGFAPHYDDIEAFVIQLEGRKHWKLYKSKDDKDTLARFSSKDYDRSELGELIGEFTLNAGSVLYFPRGVVHEARTDDEMHSLHITISTHQRTAFADLLEKALPDALQRAAANDIEFRKNLPLDYLKHLGSVNSDVKSSERKFIIQKAKELMVKLCDYVSLDDAADQMGKKFMHDALPPVPSLDEQQRSSRLDGERLYEGNLVNRSEIDPDTEIRLIRYYAIRLVCEENEYRLYYCTENAKVYHGEEEQYITIDEDSCPIVEVLLKAYPQYVKIEDLPNDDLSQKISFITELWDYGIIITKDRLEVTSDPLEDSDSECESESFDESDLSEEI